ncbi:MAG: hypothetical protein PHV75_08100 [Victivallaceae bacterium]|nr:hypothetical protein [Victivallaceae bacterium]MDD3117037.1 hypothetical protein [Victivallaceae bacterium]MDD4318464.1 hypothetical protein [Victivallaceae bacterium]MDD5663922.1 hypothetical protein [Victivallaceae bacterium]
MRKIGLFLCIVTLASIVDAEVKIVETIKEPAAGKKNRTYTVQNAGPVQNIIYYNQRKDPKTGKTITGDVTARSTGIGINYGWYRNGCIRIIVNGVPVMSPATINLDGDSLCFQWQEKDFNVQLFLTFKETSPILGEVSVSSSEPVKNIKIGFLATPGHSYFNNRYTFDRWTSTAKRNLHLNLKEKVELETNDEFWVMMYDGKHNAQRGFAALLFDPEKTERADVTGLGYIVQVHLTPKTPSENIRFMLWSVPESYMDGETLYDHLGDTATKNLDDLRNHKFSTNK